MNSETTNKTTATTAYETGEARLEHLAEVMSTNSVRQHEFAVLLRRIATRFDTGSAEGKAIRHAYRTARNKELRLQNMIDELGFEPSKAHRRNLSFLVYFRLAASAPVPLMIFLLSIGISKRVRAHLLDGMSHRPKRWTPSQFAY